MTLPPRNPRPGREFPRPGPSPEVSETSEQCAVPQGAVPQCAVPQCAVPQCAAHAAGTLRLVVEGYDAVLPMCGTHGEWVLAYAEEDARVRLLVDRRDEAE